MGLLSDLGQILTVQETMKIQQLLKRIGIRQFLHIFKKYKAFQKNSQPSIIKWGEQIEGHFLSKKENGQLQLCLQPLSAQYEGLNFPLMLEYGRWMFQMTPSEPYSTRCDFRQIIKTIRDKYKVLQSKSRIALTIPTIPFLGVRDLKEQTNFQNQITQSLYISDKHIADHIRFRTLTSNIKARRGRTVEINVPVFMDEKTSLQELAETQPNPKFIYLDAMAFGMGQSCLQCTFSTKNLDHARYLYDQMHVLSPLMLAMTAATPFHKGKMADWDSRWNIICGAVDCRTKQQRDPQSSSYLSTSRYSDAILYIGNGEANRPEYNDIQTNIPKQIIEEMNFSVKELEVDIDEVLFKHIANIFKRDFLIAHEKFKTMSEHDNILFDMLNGSNWNSVRLKIPIDDQIGWRVEFRTMEVQLTADQNSAFSLLIHFFTRILHFHTNLNLYIPISFVQKNFEIAHRNDAVRNEKFYSRINVFNQGEPIIKMLSLHEIFFGSEEYPEYPGLFPYIRQALKKECGCNNQSYMKVVDEVKEFIMKITTGQRLTLAQWMRRYINHHPDYKHNSILPKSTMDDLLLELNEIAKGTKNDPNFSQIFEF